MVISRREMVRAAGVLALAGASLLGANVARADAVDEDPINARFNEIFDKYEIGDELSAEDAAFVEEHALSADGGVARGTNTISGSRTYGGNTYYISGNWYHNDDTTSAMWHNYGATIQAGCSTVTSPQITVCMRFLAYGFTGSSYELIHKDEQSDYGTYTKWFTAEFTGGYMGLFAYSNVSCYARIKTSSGDVFVVQ